MKNLSCFVVVLCAVVVGACGSSGSGVNPDAVPYATYGEALNNAVPIGLKTGGVNADISAIVDKALSGTCAESYTDCPYVTTSGGGDEDSGEILLRLWAMDYESECTDTLLASGMCFRCEDCLAGVTGVSYIKPTMLDDPSSCVSASTTGGAHYVNFGMDPCFFDAIIGQITNIAECKTVDGGPVDISTAVPWYATWGLPQIINFSSYHSREGDGGGIWWTVNSGQYFLSLDPNWLYVGLKDTDNDRFMFFGTGSPAYFEAEASSGGFTTGVNTAAYAGTLSAIPAQFEAIQIRVQDPHKYIERIKSNGTHLWYQQWYSDSFPSTPADVEGLKNTPFDTRCLEIGTSVVYSKYVSSSDCVTSFGKASVEELNLDDNYTLKIVDGETVSAIDFGTALTPSTTDTCLPASTP